MESNKLLLIIGAAWAILCIVVAAIGGRHKNKPNSKFNRITIIIGISVPVMIGILAIIGAIFFE